MSSSDPKDGFDLIDYPCDYSFKAICKSADQIQASDFVQGLLEPLLNDGAILSRQSKKSKNGKFDSVTIKIHLTNRDELESVYKLLANSSRVVMTL